VLNGAEAIGERGGSVLVTTSVEQMDGEPHVRLTVTDEGAGMDADTCARIFEPFYTTKTRGRGLGLAAVQGIVRGHHGQLRLRSTPGRGTTFDILLPASSSTDVPPLSSAELPAVLSGGIVLLVDDEDDVRIAAAFMLEHLGYTVIEATDGRDGVNKFREYHSQLTAVLLDLTMPVMNGSEAFSAMQGISMNVPVILSSGYDETEATRRFSGGILPGFLKKPYTLRQLADAMISEG
jgi:CheY-like chemotaxis protein